jgi:hypothetical protein
MNSTLCKNDGQCVDETTNQKGFKCICSIEYQGEYCEKRKKNRSDKFIKRIII